MTSSGTNAHRKGNRVSDEDIEKARFEVTRAFQLLGLAGQAGRPVCPSCGTDKRGKVALRDSKGYWKCYRCGEYGSPTKLLTDIGGYGFVDAINDLLGRDVSDTTRQRKPRELVEIRSSADFSAEIDVEVYLWIARQGDRARAAEYYAEWHLSPQAVKEAGCFYLPLPKGELTDLQAQAVAEFGRDRLIACGVAMEMDPEKVRPARTAAQKAVHGLFFPGMPPGYPVGEPHVTADGEITYIQFRPDGRTKQRVDAHKAGKKARERVEMQGGDPASVQVPDYVAPYLSFRGMPHDAMIGGGVWRLGRLDAGSTVVIVEGIKDLMAARTMGAEAYAIPGAKTSPPQAVCEILKRHKVVVALDGDDAGNASREQLVELLQEQGLPNVKPKPMPDGMDVTDILIDRHASKRCACATCQAWRASHVDAA